MCDDGNNLSGDGCSADCKTVDAGFTCTQPPLGECIDVPVVYRDFLIQHVDFEPSALGRRAPRLTGLVGTTLDAQGKPTLAGTAAATSHRQRGVVQGLVHGRHGVNHATATTLRLCRNAAGNYVNRWGLEAATPWPVTKTAYFCGNVDNAMLDRDRRADPVHVHAMGRPIATWSWR